VDGAVFVQADVNGTGAMAGQWVAENVPSGKVAIIQGALGRGDAEAYTQSFKDALAANPQIEVIGEPAADWARDKALAAMQDLLTANPDLAAVFVQNEDMALGAIQAIKAAGASTIVVSQNGSPDGLAAIESGELAATVGWSPAQEAQMALSRLVTAIRTGTAPEPKLCQTPLKLVTKDDIASAYSWIPTEESTAAALSAAAEPDMSIGIGFLEVTHPHVYTRADILARWRRSSSSACGSRTMPLRLRVRRSVRGGNHADARHCSPTRVDAVIVEPWTHRMADVSIMALEAGKKVMLEKPASNDPANMAGSSRRSSGRWLLSVGNGTAVPASRRLTELHASGLLGRTTVGRFHVSVPAPDAVTPWFNLEQDIGGVLFEDGCHMFDLVLDLLGKPRSVGAFVPKYDDLARRHGHRYEDAAVVILEWDDLVGTLSLVGWEANDWLETWELALFGEAGSAFAGPLPARLDVFLKDAGGAYPAGWTRHRETAFNVSWLDHEAKHVWHAVQHRSFFRAELERFIGDVRDGGSPEIPASHGLAVTETIAALYRASRERRTIEL